MLKTYPLPFIPSLGGRIGRRCSAADFKVIRVDDIFPCSGPHRQGSDELGVVVLDSRNAVRNPCLIIPTISNSSNHGKSMVIRAIDPIPDVLRISKCFFVFKFECDFCWCAGCIFNHAFEAFHRQDIFVGTGSEDCEVCNSPSAVY